MGRAKKPTAKGKKESARKAGKAISRQQKPDENQDDDKNEFGILPNRDLKKNLGCG